MGQSQGVQNIFRISIPTPGAQDRWFKVNWPFEATHKLPESCAFVMFGPLCGAQPFEDPVRSPCALGVRRTGCQEDLCGAQAPIPTFFSRVLIVIQAVGCDPTAHMSSEKPRKPTKTL